MDNTAALADVINGLIEDPETDLTAHGLAVRARIPWPTYRRRLVGPGATGPKHLDELERIASVLGMRPSELLALAEKQQEHGTTSKAA